MLRDREWQYRDGRLLVQGRTGDARGRNGIIRTSAMREKKEETARVRYSIAYPTGRERIGKRYEVTATVSQESGLSEA